jgi:RNA polymerase-interacting CarD/CdnL/TRCF family regulator
MAEHHHETSLRLLKEWKSLIDKQAEAIATGDVQNLEKLIRQSSSIQHQLSQSLAASDKNAHGKKIARMLRELHHEQGCVIEALKAQATHLADEIGALQKDMNSIRGYKKQGAKAPRFMNERT